MSLATYFASAAQARQSVMSRYGDLVLVAGVVVIVALMVLPLPPLLVDMLVAINISCGVLLLLVAIYVRSPLEFSVFPSVLLITTLFRLALSIATTRMILLEAHAGDIIDTFGQMVAGGNLVVGLVVFLIITVVQFIVIAKGAERVAEVAARFTLDAMPGKQLSIDSDLRSGLIDKDEARRKRREIELESKLHGSLDGAMKFVKGDAIASIVIVVINLLGGLAIGVLQRDLTLASAMHTYSILSIGEGLVAQIPALLGAMAAGLIVTRATDEERDRHLSDAIGRQIAAKPRVLLVAAGLCVMLSLVPGFPTGVFLLLAFFLGAGGAWVTAAWRERFLQWTRPARESVSKRTELAPTVMATQVPVAQPTVPLLLELPPNSLTATQAQQLVQALQEVLDEFQLKLGLLLPRIAVHPRRDREADGQADAEDTATAQTWRLLAYEVPVAHGAMPKDDAPRALADACLQALRRHTPLFLGTQEASALLTRAGQDYPDVVKEVLRALPLARVAEILRRLVEEEMPIRNQRDILEALADAAQREKDVFALTEMARIALKRHTSHRIAPQGVLRALLLTPEFEERLRGAVRVNNGQQSLALEPQEAHQAMQCLTRAVHVWRPAAIVTAVDVRRHVRKLIEADAFDTTVVSFHELMPNLQLEVLHRTALDDTTRLEAA
jgi:type III secretion protein V